MAIPALSVFAAVCLPVCANSAVPDLSIPPTVLADLYPPRTMVRASGPELATAGHGRPTAPTGVHPSLAGRPDWGGHRWDGGHGRPRARRGGGGAFLQGEEYEVVGGAADGALRGPHARYSRAPRAYFGWAGDRPRSSRSLLRVQTRHCVGSDRIVDERSRAVFVRLYLQIRRRKYA